MCGIVGYVGHREAVPVLVKGLEHLEYRGYDSAGVAYIHKKSDIGIIREKGKLSKLKAQVQKKNPRSKVAIGHTRWATHGEPSKQNAHPHKDVTARLALVHNGIVENHEVLKKELLAKGYKFQSQTDTEVAVNLISSYYKKGGNLVDAFTKAIKRMEGFFAFVLLSEDHPDQILVFKRSNPLVIGLGKNENFAASDVPALLAYTKKVIYLNDEEYAIIKNDRVDIYSLKTNKKVKHKPTEIKWNITQAAKGGYAHFMLKEIFEQPQVAETTLHARIKKNKIFFDSITPKIKSRLEKIKNVHFVSCGTAYHAGLVGNYMLGECVGLPIEATVSSEFRYEDPSVGKNDLVIFITQSGETADTLAALREAKRKGALTLSIVNVVGSTIARESDCVLYTYAGPEIGVASTKAYVAQLITLTLFSLYMGQIHKNKKLKPARIQQLLKELQKLPKQIEETLKQEKVIKKCSRQLYRKQTFLYLGRGYNFPNALEGALKLKEITYSHAHGYPAGEMKHGPIALIDKNQPVICLATASRTHDKMLSNIEEIKARKGIIISIGTKGDKSISRISNYTFSIPKTEEMFSPILTAIPLQLFAYQVAVFKKRDVDQPRNLAKSVTVE